MRVVFIGAGSVVFTRNLTRDILTFPELSDSEIVLMDIDAERLSRAPRSSCSRMAETAASPARVLATTDRRQALTEADYVVVTIQVGGNAQWEADIAIPERYGVGQCVGDTIGPGGIFRGLRHLAVFDGLIEDMAELCPRRPGPAVLQPDGHPDLAASPGRSQGRGPLPQRPGNGAATGRVLRGPLRGAQLLGGRDQPPGLVPHPRAPRPRPLPLSARAARQPGDARPGARAFRAHAPLRLLRDRVQRARVRVPSLFPQAARPPRLAWSRPSSRAGSDYSAWLGYGETGGCRRRHATKQPAYEQEVARQVAGSEPMELRRSDEYGARIIHSPRDGYLSSHQRQRAQ